MNATFTSKLNDRRTGQKKVRLMADLMLGKSVIEAKRILTFSPRKGAFLLLKTLNSAVASAKDSGVKLENLKIAKVLVDQGTPMKRAKAASRGRMNTIHKPTSHITVSVTEVSTTKKEAK
ncbi:MAG: 50S ribosomal protein L22 [candidate division WWE3 bacterium]|nr:50S ribosomal protein L22 [candidate division WWE3 bacterium]